MKLSEDIHFDTCDWVGHSLVPGTTEFPYGSYHNKDRERFYDMLKESETMKPELDEQKPIAIRSVFSQHQLL